MKKYARATQFASLFLAMSCLPSPLLQAQNQGAGGPPAFYQAGPNTQLPASNANPSVGRPGVHGRPGFHSQSDSNLLTGANNQPEEVASAGVVVLRNGRAMQGEIKRELDRISVTRSDRSVVRVPIKLVDFVAPNMETAYEHQARRMRDNNVDSRVQLVEWCMQYSMVDNAAQQLAIVRFKAPKHPKLAYLERRIQQARQPTRAASGAPPRAHNDGPKTKVAATPAELQRFTKELPDGAVEHFTHVIQPMLINRCGATACHGVRAESEYRLISPSIAGVFSHRYTQRNLLATVTQVRDGDLANTKWLRAALNPHAGLKKPLFSDKEMDKLTRLVAWARTVGPAPNGQDPRQRLLQSAASVTEKGGTNQPDRTTTARAAKEVIYDPGVRPAAFGGQSQQPSQGGNSTSGRATDLVPNPPSSTDPFDPKAFNQAKPTAKRQSGSAPRP